VSLSFTRNLRLRLEGNITANARYNLERLDTLLANYAQNNDDLWSVKSRGNILIEPASIDLGGAGSDGQVDIGSVDNPLASLNIYSDDINLSSHLSLKDQATSGNKYLRLKYNSTLSGSVDTSDNRALSFDLQGADRSAILGGDLTLADALTTVGAYPVTFTATDTTSVTLPLTGTLATLAGSETLTNKSIDADSNTITNIDNADIKAAAGIVYSKLSLANSIVNADVSSSAAIAYSKLDLSGQILNADVSSSAAITYSKLSLTGSIVNADISGSAGIDRLKLSAGTANYVLINAANGLVSEEAYLDKTRGGTGISSTATFPSSGTVTTDVNVQTFTNKTIDAGQNTITGLEYADLDLTGGIVNADVNAGAAIDGSKIDPTFGNQQISTSAGLKLDGTTYYASINPAASGQTADLDFYLPPDYGNSGEFLVSDGAGGLTFAAAGAVTSVALSAPSDIFNVSGSPITSSGTLAVTAKNQTANYIWAGPSSGSAAAPAFRALVSDDIPTLAATKIGAGSVDDTEFGYLNGVTSAIQTQINGKEPTITTLSVAKGGTNSGTALNDNRIMQSSSGSIIEAAAITASRALVSDANGIPTHTSVTTTELGYLSGVTSAIQTQISDKVAKAGDTLTGPLLEAAGSASAPSYSFSGDANTGIYSAGADTLNIATGGTHRATFDSSGYVGIGTSSPETTLHVAKSSTIGTYGENGQLRVSGLSGSDANKQLAIGVDYSSIYAWLQANNWTSGYMNLYLQPKGGNVGVGTTSASQLLSVAGTFGIREGGLSPSYYTIFQGGDQGADITYTLPTAQGGSNTVLSNNGSGVLSWVSSGSSPAYGAHGSASADTVYVSSTSKVGIGTTSPQAFLDVTGSNAAASVGTETTLQLTRKENTGYSYPQVATFALGSYANNSSLNNYGPKTRLDISLKSASDSNLTATTTVMTMLSSGYVGINATAPAGMFEVDGSVAADPVAIFKGAGSQSGALSSWRNSSDAELTSVKSDGTIYSSTLTASRALTTNSSNEITASSVTTTELGYLSGVTSAIQTQINTKTTKSTYTWAPADGTSKSVTHNFGTTDVSFTIYDIDSGATILVDSEVRTNSNTADFTSSAAPSGSGWKIIVRN
jgi:hypothetical protein